MIKFFSRFGKKIAAIFLIVFFWSASFLPFLGQSFVLAQEKEIPVSAPLENKRDALSPEEVSAKKQSAQEKIQSVQIPFVQNQGQLENEAVKFYADIFSGDFFVTDDSLNYSLKKDSAKINVREKFINNQGETLSFDAQGKEATTTKVSYFKSDQASRWKNGLASFNKLELGEVWENVAVSLKAEKSNVEKIFTVQPGGSSEQIKIKTDSTDNLFLDENGQLIYQYGNQKISMTAPIAYQEENGQRIEVEVSYQILAKQVYGFRVGQYDQSKPLIIDPLLAGTFLEGSEDGGLDYPAISVAPDGSVFFVGQTYDATFPATAGAYDETFNGSGYSEDLIVAKFNSDLTQLLALTYLGGSGDESSWNSMIDFDSSGNVFISLDSLSADFPIIAGAYDSTYNGGDFFNGDLVIAKFNSDLTQLLASTYLGSATVYGESAGGLVVDSGGNVYSVTETGCNFPTTAGAAFETCSVDVTSSVVVKLDNNLSNLLASTYMHGIFATAIALDPTEENVFIAGISAADGLYTTPGAFQTTSPDGGFYVDFGIAKISSDLSTIVASTYLGGNDWEAAAKWSQSALAVDSAGNVFYGGETESTDFPVTAGAYDQEYAGRKDSFISKFDSNLSTLLASTFFGGEETEEGFSLALNSEDEVYVTAWTDSSDFFGMDNFPTTQEAFQKNEPGEPNDGDVFVSKFSNDLSTLEASTYLGGSESGYEFFSMIDIDSSDNVYLAGYTEDSHFPIASGAFDEMLENVDGGFFISKLDSDLSAPAVEHFEVRAIENFQQENFEEGFDTSVWDETFSLINYGVYGSVYATAIQSDGKIVIGGDFDAYNGVGRLNIARINPDGSLDETFDPGMGAEGNVYSIAIQPDGKILLGGSFFSYNGISRSRIARINSDGSLDETFDPGMGSDGSVNALAIQSDGKILLGGYFYEYDGTDRNMIARINSDGSLDETFNPGTGANSSVNKINFQLDGQIIITGLFTTYNGTSRNRIARINTNGTLDTSFAPGTAANGEVKSFEIQSDGKIVIVGAFTTYAGVSRNRIARVNADGTLDTSFAPGTGANGTVYALGLQSDGKIIISGSFTLYNGTSKNRYAQVNTDGTLDGAFTVTSPSSYTQNVRIIGGDKMIISGFGSINRGSYSYFNLAKLENDGTEDTAFNQVSPETSGWSLDEDQSISGTASLYSSGNGVARNLRLSTSFDFPSDGQVSFWWKSVIEDPGGYDAGTFCVDVDPGYCDPWSNGYFDRRINKTTDWTYVSVPVSAGSHYFEWFLSGYAYNGGIWLDDIKFSSSLASHTVTGGESQSIQIFAFDTEDQISQTYFGDKQITFSGLSSDSGDPVVADKDGVDVSFGAPATLTFYDGVAVADFTTYTAETASIDITDGTYDSFDDPDYDLDLMVEAGSLPSPTPTPSPIPSPSPSPSPEPSSSPSPSPTPTSDLEEERDDYIDLIDYQDGKLVFDLKISKDKKIKSETVAADKDESTQVKKIAVKTKKDERIKGEIEIKSKKEPPPDVVFPNQVDGCMAFQIINVNSDFSEDKVKETEIYFRIPNGWLKKNKLEKLVFVQGKKASSGKTKSAVLTSELSSVKEDTEVYKVSSDSLDAYWGVFGCFSESESIALLTDESEEKVEEKAPTESPTKQDVQQENWVIPETSPSIGLPETTDISDNDNNFLPAVSVLAYSASRWIEENQSLTWLVAYAGLILPAIQLSFQLNSFRDTLPLLRVTFWRIFGFFGFRRKERKVGVVYDAKTGTPIPLARVEVFDEVAGKTKEVKITDKYGSVFFLVPAGKFKLSAFRLGYQAIFSQALNRFYPNTYQGETLSFENMDKIDKNISLQKEENGKTLPLSNIFWDLLLSGLFYLGFVFNLAIFIFFPHPLNLAILLGYLVLGLIRKINFGRLKWGEVLDASGLPLPLVSVKLFNLSTQQLVGRAITDEQGRYLVVADAGQYRLEASISGEKNLQINREIALKDRGEVKEKLILA